MQKSICMLVLLGVASAVAWNGNRVEFPYTSKCYSDRLRPLTIYNELHNMTDHWRHEARSNEFLPNYCQKRLTVQSSLLAYKNATLPCMQDYGRKQVEIEILYGIICEYDWHRTENLLRLFGTECAISKIHKMIECRTTKGRADNSIADKVITQQCMIDESKDCGNITAVNIFDSAFHAVNFEGLCRAGGGVQPAPAPGQDICKQCQLKELQKCTDKKIALKNCTHIVYVKNSAYSFNFHFNPLIVLVLWALTYAYKSVFI